MGEMDIIELDQALAEKPEETLDNSQFVLVSQNGETKRVAASDFVPKAEYDKLEERLIWVEMGNPPRWFRESLVAFYDTERQGSSNEEMLELRKAGRKELIRDFGPNKLDLEAKNFVWKGLSGFGGYETENWDLSGVHVSTIKEHLINITEIRHGDRPIYYKNSVDAISFRIKVSGITESQKIRYAYYDGSISQSVTIDHNGIYTLPASKAKENFNVGFISAGFVGICDITIEILPLYPNALVFDGVDDFLINDNFPIFTKEKGYTVISRVKVLDYGNSSSVATKRSNAGVLDGAFWFQREADTRSFGTSTKISSDKLSDINWQTSKSFNGTVPLTVGDAPDSHFLTIGNVAASGASGYSPMKAVFCQQLYFNRDLELGEIKWVLDHYFPKQAEPQEPTV